MSRHKPKTNRKHLGITGDVHGMLYKYIHKMKDYQYSIQIGDMSAIGYNELKSLPWKNHKFFGGNHDNYDVYDLSPHSLGDYGIFTLAGFRFYFIRGAFSIDGKFSRRSEQRGKTKMWWKEEQLSNNQLADVIEDFGKCRPDTVITHTCPQFVAKRIGKPSALRMFGFDPLTFQTNTQRALQFCWEAHQPKLWIYGHFHQNICFEDSGTLFVCLNELQTMDFDSHGRFNHNGYSGKIE